MKEETIEIRARVERDGRMWVAFLDDGGVTQARSLMEIEDTVADYVALMRDVPAANVRVVIMSVSPGAGIEPGAIEAARQQQREAARATAAAAERVRALAITLRESGLSGVEIAKVLEVSPQRVSQLTSAARPPARPRRIRVAAAERPRKADRRVDAPIDDSADS